MGVADDLIPEPDQVETLEFPFRQSTEFDDRSIAAVVQRGVVNATRWTEFYVNGWVRRFGINTNKAERYGDPNPRPLDGDNRYLEQWSYDDDGERTDLRAVALMESNLAVDIQFGRNSATGRINRMHLCPNLVDSPSRTKTPLPIETRRWAGGAIFLACTKSRVFGTVLNKVGIHLTLRTRQK